MALPLPSKPLRPTAGATKMVVLEASGAGEAELFAGLATSSEGGGRVPGAKASAANGTRSSSQGASQVFLTNRNFCKLVSLARRRWRTGWRCFSSGVAGIITGKASNRHSLPLCDRRRQYQRKCYCTQCKAVLHLVRRKSSRRHACPCSAEGGKTFFCHKADDSGQVCGVSQVSVNLYEFCSMNLAAKFHVQNQQVRRSHRSDYILVYPVMAVNKSEPVPFFLQSQP